jgi:translation elongation factor EF-4
MWRECYGEAIFRAEEKLHRKAEEEVKWMKSLQSDGVRRRLYVAVLKLDRDS